MDSDEPHRWGLSGSVLAAGGGACWHGRYLWLGPGARLYLLWNRHLFALGDRTYQSGGEAHQALTGHLDAVVVSSGPGLGVPHGKA